MRTFELTGGRSCPIVMLSPIKISPTPVGASRWTVFIAGRFHGPQSFIHLGGETDSLRVELKRRHTGQWGAPPGMMARQLDGIALG